MKKRLKEMKKEMEEIAKYEEKTFKKVMQITAKLKEKRMAEVEFSREQTRTD